MEERLAAAELATAVERSGLPTQAEPPDGGASTVRADLWIDVNGRWVAVEVKSAATVMPAQARRLVATHPAPAQGAVVVVADRVVAAAREELRRAGWGWLDRRGHLRLEGPGILLDTDVEPAPDLDGPSRPLATKVGREVAAELLLHPDGRPGVRPLATRLGRAPSSVSDALAGLRDVGLAGDGNAPQVPELFWELADHWPTSRVALSAVPVDAADALTARLHLDLARLGDDGWALTDTVAAAVYGAPVGLRSGHPPDFFAPDASIVRLARMQLGAAPSDERACTVRAAPVPQACRDRADGAALRPSTSWPLTRPLFVALDLAADPGRGREILDGWDPPPPWRRVW